MKNIVPAMREYFKSGETLSIKYRLEQLKALKKTLLKYDEALIQALYDDLNKSSFEAVMTETGIIMEELNYYIKNLKRLSSPKKVKVPLTLQPGRSRIHYEPYGVVLIISPWNYPVQLTLSPLIAAIAAGNCAVVKLSEFSENTSLILSQIINETFQREYIRVVRGDAVAGAALLLEKFNYIFFTGNQNVGKIVMKSASSNLTPVTLELGGKSPCIVDLSADIKDTVNKIVSELADDDGIAELYDEWNKVNRDKLSLYYDKPKPDIPLEDNKEFLSIKNMIVKAAVEFTTAEISAAHTAEIDTTVKSFVSALVRMITQSYKKKISRLNSQIDGKLKSKIEQKKQAHGLKTDRSVQTDHSEDEEQEIIINM